MKFTKQDIPFSQIANEVLNSKRLSWKAKGVYAYLYSKPQNWNFSAIRIKNDGKQTTDKNGKIRSGGRAEILSAIQELEEAGYLSRKKLGNGRIQYHISNTTQSPVTELRGDPESGDRTVQSPHRAVTEPMSNKDKHSSNKEVNSAPAGGAFSPKYEITKLKTDRRRHIQLIGEYIEEKKIPINNKEELNVIIRRHCRSAVDLSKFSDERIGWATNVAMREYPAYTLETLVKILSR